MHNNVVTLFHINNWCGFLNLSDRTYIEPMMGFLSAFSRDDEDEIFTLQLQGQDHRLTYRRLDSIMGTDRDINTHSHQ